MVPDEIIDRFRRDLDALVPTGTRIGIAVSGGPDSLALLLLAAAARPGGVGAATVDHGFRTESRAEAEAIASTCKRLGLPHAILTLEWENLPASAIQERARSARYGALANWMRECGLSALLTGHHLDDQAETLVMRLNRGSGVTGLAGMRPVAAVPGAPELKLVRPLLGWRRTELEAICLEAGEDPAVDPSNADPRHERVRVRRALSNADWLDPEAIARSSANLAYADVALDWVAGREWNERVTNDRGGLSYSPTDAPFELRRRVAARAISELSSEGPSAFRGAELDRLLDALTASRTATLRGVRCQGGKIWHFERATPRRAKNRTRPSSV